jgi:hypothetical protein
LLLFNHKGTLNTENFPLPHPWSKRHMSHVIFTHSNEEKQKSERDSIILCLQKRLHDWKGAYDGVGVGIVGVWMFIRGALKRKQEILLD